MRPELIICQTAAKPGDGFSYGNDFVRVLSCYECTYFTCDFQGRRNRGTELTGFAVTVLPSVSESQAVSYGRVYGVRVVPSDRAGCYDLYWPDGSHAFAVSPADAVETIKFNTIGGIRREHLSH